MVDSNLLRSSANEAHGPLAILYRRKPSCGRVSARDLILEHDSRHTDRIQPFGHFGPFQVVGEDVVPSSRRDDDRRSRIDHRPRLENRNAWGGDIGQSNDAASAHKSVIGPGPIELRRKSRDFSGWFPGPQIPDNRLGSLGSGDNNASRENCRSNPVFHCALPFVGPDAPAIVAILRVFNRRYRHRPSHVSVDRLLR